MPVAHTVTIYDDLPMGRGLHDLVTLVGMCMGMIYFNYRAYVAMLYSQMIAWCFRRMSHFSGVDQYRKKCALI